MKVLVTGAAGFVGFHLVQRLLGRGDEVVGLDNLSDYYSVALKEARLAQVRSGRFRFVKMDLADREALPALFAAERFDAVVNLAAQAGVRYSVENPWAYVDSNVVGFLNVLECCRHNPVRHLVYASSSSVYGGNEKTPFSEEDRVDDPVSLYAATKKSDELMAACYSKLYGIPTTGLRFFTVYGPWGRPDMSPMLFASAILAGKPLKVFNHGDMLRDFTYVDDIVEGVVRVLDRQPVRHEIYNIGCSHPVRLMDFISELERALGRKAEKILLPMQPGDVYQTYADTSKLERELGYKPRVMLREGIDRFVAWYLSDENPLR
ncbi:MAG: NAD-dependent epimerase [Bacteroidales bacterium]|nr:NAD-dependent epimerase [Bacteroidales bacterium]